MPTMSLIARVGFSSSSFVACFRASAISFRRRSSSMSSAFVSGSLEGNGQPLFVREYQSDIRTCMSLTLNPVSRLDTKDNKLIIPFIAVNESIELPPADVFQVLFILPPIGGQRPPLSLQSLLQLVPHGLLGSKYKTDGTIQLHEQ